MTKRVTINDVAQAAGVSRQTVTRAINGMGEINEQTKQRVLEACERLGYRPSRFARNLVARKKTRAIGYLVASFRNPYYTEIAGDLLNAAAARGWHVLMASTETEEESAAMEMLAGQVDLFMGHFFLPDDDLAQVCRGVPLVMVDRLMDRPGMHSVEIDLREGVRHAIEALRAKGVRHLGMIDSDFTMRDSPTYHPSFRREWFEELAGAESARMITVGEESLTGGGKAFAELVAAHPEVDAVLVYNDLMAIGAVQASHALGIEVPGRVRICGIDGLSLGEAVHPRLTTLSMGREAVVNAALDIAEELAAADFAPLPPMRRVVNPCLIWRESA
ncbi:LacI family DNA-binding transcriptional regulator [Nonomuraea angiospora]|uniref:LacI family DNA-binding transcriptional regulator n=1 Tax=Nonomuraea angiospora TaxID=46172 RepID=UPI0029B0D717|nr:LacI family DNA-binding transcriptional regulator [Nonomuraea angiospora]MDX3109280.1 LacI family DNA-binding transcriptional regulator [Nonomuraea angiospora]